MLPREKLDRLGAERLTNEELLAIVFGTGYKKVPVVAYARGLLEQYRTDGLGHVRSVEQLRNAGVPPVKAAQTVACFTLGQRLFHPLPEKELHTPGEVFNHLQWMCSVPREQTRVILLDARAHILHEETVALGVVNAHMLQPKDLLRTALKYNAVNTIIVHNHPSGDPTPSQADLKLTKTLVTGCEQIGIPLLDHIVIGKRSYKSLRAEFPNLFS